MKSIFITDNITHDPVCKFYLLYSTIQKSTSNPGPFDIEAAREEALVKSGHVTPQILDVA